MRILLVEDDQLIGDGLKVGLEKLGFAVDWFTDGLEGEEALYQASYAAVVLDLGLPGQDGLEVLKNWRQKSRTEPVLILTARGDVDQRIAGLNSGADDYLAKPFSLMELTSRCRALLRRGGMMSRPAPEMLSVGGIELSPSHREVRVDGHELKLTLREFDLLEYLMRKPGVVFTRESLLQSVWGWDFDGGSRTVDGHVQTLRQKLGSHADRIETVRGVGYRLVDRAAADEAVADSAE